MNFDQTLNNRRALRTLGEIEISEEDIKELARAASLAPSCYNKQPWRYVFVREEQQLQKLVQAMPQGNQAWATNASMIIGVFANKNNDCIVGSREYYQFDTGMATCNLLLKATEMGLVAHPIAGFDQDQCADILNIPEESELITLLVVGKKVDEIDDNLPEEMQETEKNRPERKKFKEYCFLDKLSG